LKPELCADELVAAHFSSAATVWLYGRRRRRQRRQTEWQNTETAHSLDRRFFPGFKGSATSSVISAGLLAPKS